MDPAIWVPHHQLVAPELHPLQLVQGFGSHVGVLEVDKGAEAFMKNSDAFNLTEDFEDITEVLLCNFLCNVSNPQRATVSTLVLLRKELQSSGFK